MNGLYIGRVAHARFGEKRHKLSYRVFMAYLDLDEPPKAKLFSLNRFNLLALHDRDHANRKRSPIKPQIEQILRDHGIAWPGGAISLLTMPRLLHYVFNPLSVYFCRRTDGALAAIVYEVANTFGERHTYVLPADPAQGENIAQGCEKRFFVSPFLDMDLRYEFRIAPPGERVSIAMIVKRGDAPVLTASFAGDYRPFDDANILRAWAGNPLMTLKVIMGIHWEALKMWTKGIRFIGRPKLERQKGDSLRHRPSPTP